MSSIGIMDPAFFVGKNILLKWLNDFFDAGYSKVEQCASGAIYCQILDCLYPGKVPLSRVNFDAKYDYEFVANWKILQNIFDKEQIAKHVDVAKLVKAKYQDNLEFLQWMKNFFETNYNQQPYDAKQRREEAKSSYKKGHKHAGTSKIGSGAAAAKPAAPAAAAPKPTESTTKPAAAKPAAAKPAAASKPAAAAKPAASAVKKAVPSSGKSSSAEVAELNDQLNKLRLTIEGLEKERNFYFGKLREIEILCQNEEDGETSVPNFKQTVLQILYQTDGSDEFTVPNEEEQGMEEPAEEQYEEGLLDNQDLEQ